VRADVEVCRPAQRTDGAAVGRSRGENVLMGDQMDFLVGTARLTDFSALYEMADSLLRNCRTSRSDAAAVNVATNAQPRLGNVNQLSA